MSVLGGMLVSIMGNTHALSLKCKFSSLKCARIGKRGRIKADILEANQTRKARYALFSDVPFFIVIIFSD
jgi:hypothetical protein